MIKVVLTGFLLTGGMVMAQSTDPAPYCDGSFDDMDGFPVADAITNVSFGNLTNNSGSQFAAPHYVFYSNLQAAAVQKGNSYPLSLTFDVHGGCGYGVWIDYNQNNQFEASEKVAGNAANDMLELSSATVVTANVVIPMSAAVGTTRMRIRIVEDDMYNMANAWVPIPCNQSSGAEDIMDWGETEDYVINITGNAVGVSELDAVAQLSIQNDHLSIKGIAIEQMNLYNMSGELVRTATSELMDLSGINNGVYLLKALASNGQLLDYKIIR